MSAEFIFVDGVRFVVRDGVLITAKAAGVVAKWHCEGCNRELFDSSDVAEWISQCNGGGDPYCHRCAAQWRLIRRAEYVRWRGSV